MKLCERPKYCDISTVLSEQHLVTTLCKGEGFASPLCQNRTPCYFARTIVAETYFVVHGVLRAKKSNRASMCLIRAVPGVAD